MSAIFNPIKATALPQTPAPHSLYFIKSGSDVRVKGYVSDANGTVFPLGIIDEQDVLSVQLNGFTVGSDTPITSTNSIFNAFRNVQAQINTLSSAVAGGIKIPQPLDASTNPNYPQAQAGDSYIVTVAGRIGGASGPLVEIGDKIVALTANAGGTQAAVGSAWFILNTNIDRATTTTFGTVRTATQGDVTGFSSQEAYVSPATLAGGVRASLLTGFAVGTNTAIGSGDSVLQAFGKVQGQLDARLVGTGSAGQVSFWTGAGVQSGDSGLVWDNVSKHLNLPLSVSRINLGTQNSDRGGLNISQTGGSSIINLKRSDSSTIGGKALIEIHDSSSNAVASISFFGDGVDNSGRIEFRTDTNALQNNGYATPLRWSILSNGILQSNGAQTIQTSTGNLNLATAGGNGNILLSPNGTGAVLVGTTSPLLGGGRLQVNGQLNVATVNNATGDFLTHVNGIVNKRTAAQVRAEIMVWTETQW